MEAAQRESLVGRWRKALCLSNQERDDLGDILAAHALMVGQWGNMAVAPRKRAAGRLAFRHAIEVLASAQPAAASQIRTELAEVGVDLSPTTTRTHNRRSRPDRLGLDPGPTFKRILNTVYDAQLDGSIRTRVEALELARKLGV